MKHIVKVLNTEFVTHDVKRFTVEKPAGYTFIPGQATDVSINKPSLENELRPFTFTSLADSDTLEFTIKIYKGHNGVTEKLGDVIAGDELILHDVFGTITYHGPGLFIAAGAGITPFIAIFRSLHKENKLAGNFLLFANRTEEDIILKEELRGLLGINYVDVIEKGKDENTPPKYINKELIKQHLQKENKYTYICGPDKFTAAMVIYLQELGMEKSNIIIEQ
jgi:ferredoxin-NADP reductase